MLSRCVMRARHDTREELQRQKDKQTRREGERGATTPGGTL